MNKLSMGAVIAGVSAAGGLWWWYTSRELHAPAAHQVDARLAHGNRAAVEAHDGSGAPKAPAPGHVIRMDNVGLRRRELADQIAVARARRIARSTGGTAGSSVDLSAMDSPEHVLAQMMGSLKEVRDYVSSCVAQSGTAVPGFKAELVLTGDPDVGTLIDASALVSPEGRPLPVQLDDCVREVMQTLELPPMAIGEAFKVGYEFTFDDEPR